MTTKQILSAVVGVALAAAIGIGWDQAVENVDSNEVKVFQGVISGDLTVHQTAGIKQRWFDQIATYKKRDFVEFNAPKGMAMDDPNAKIYGMPIRFNDQGAAVIFGDASYTLSTNEKELKLLRTEFPTMEQLEAQLIRPAIQRAVYMTGPTMSSKESTAKKRPVLVEYITDQTNNGVYKIETSDEEIIDPLSGEKRTVTVATILIDVKAINQRARLEESPLERFGIKIFNLQVKKIKYDKNVERQIEAQRKIFMDIQTAIAKAKEAEQNAIKAVEEGKANAATAKWAQETLNATDIALAEKNKKVAKLDKEAARFTKDKDILLGQGIAEKRKLIMKADGALKMKMDTMKEIARINAEAIRDYKGNWVPQIVYGGGGGTGGTAQYSAAQTMMETLTVKAMKDLSLDLSTK